MICIKTEMEKLPEYCDDCQWYGTRPHPYNGWTNICELMSHCMDDDQPEEWVYTGGGRPKACPLVEMEDDTISRQAALTLAKDIVVPTEDGTIYRHRCIDPSEILELPPAHGEEKNEDTNSNWSGSRHPCCHICRCGARREN